MFHTQGQFINYHKGWGRCFCCSQRGKFDHSCDVYYCCSRTCLYHHLSSILLLRCILLSFIPLAPGASSLLPCDIWSWALGCEYSIQEYKAVLTRICTHTALCSYIHAVKFLTLQLTKSLRIMSLYDLWMFFSPGIKVNSSVLGFHSWGYSETTFYWFVGI